MKYKLLGLAALALVLAAALVLTPVGSDVPSGRYPQPLSARADTGCGCGNTQLCSHLPLVLIDTRGQEVPGELTGRLDRFHQAVYTKAEDGQPTIRAQITVIDNPDRNNHPGDQPAFTTESDFRIRGHSSRYYPKRPYLMKFVDEDGQDRDIPVMGMGAHHEWALHSPMIDKTLVRNYLMYNLSGEIMDWAPNCRFCEVVVNGSYEGVYLMVETITDGDDCRLNLKMRVKNSQAAGYLLRLDRPTEEDLESVRDVYTYAERINRVFQDFAIRYPGRNSLTQELKRSIELDYATFEKSLYSYDYKSSRYGYENWIDTDNFVDYYILQELSQNYDMGAYSTYLYKELGQPYRLAVWDFDNAWGNARATAILPDKYILNERAWYWMLFKDEAFVRRVIDRYRELRQTWLSQEYLLSYIDQTVEWLGPAAERNNLRWADRIADWDALGPEYDNPHSFREALDMMKTRIIQRGAWLDEEIHSLQQLCHPSRNKKYNH